MEKLNVVILLTIANVLEIIMLLTRKMLVLPVIIIFLILCAILVMVFIPKVSDFRRVAFIILLAQILNLGLLVLMTGLNIWIILALITIALAAMYLAFSNSDSEKKMPHTKPLDVIEYRDDNEINLEREEDIEESNVQYDKRLNFDIEEYLDKLYLSKAKEDNKAEEDNKPITAKKTKRVSKKKSSKRSKKSSNSNV